MTFVINIRELYEALKVRNLVSPIENVSLYRSEVLFKGIQILKDGELLGHKEHKALSLYIGEKFPQMCAFSHLW